MLRLYYNYYDAYIRLSIPIVFPLVLMGVLWLFFIVKNNVIMSFYYCFYRVLFEIYLKYRGVADVILLSFLKGVILGYIYDKKVESIRKNYGMLFLCYF